MKLLNLVLLLLAFSGLAAQDFEIDTLSINSGILEENRNILVFKPKEFGNNDSVQFIYLLDGESAEYRYKKLINENMSKHCIGIGIVNTNRNRDMLPVKEADKFLEFIEKELIPEVEKDFKVNQKILFGHSFAGCFTIYSMLNKPGLFDKYISSSPTPIMNMVDPPIYNRLDAELKNQIKFYFSYGSKDMKQVRKWGGRLNTNLLGIKFNNIVVKSEINEGKTHNSNDLSSLINGIKF